MTSFMIGGLDATLAIYTGDVMGFTSTEVGIVFTYIGFLILIMQSQSGKLLDRFGEMKMIPAGLVLSGLGFFLLTFAHDGLSIMAALGVFVAGNSLVMPSVNSLITKKVQGKRGAVLGLASSFNSLGQMIGPLLGGFLYGVRHDLAFLGLAAVIWAYTVIFIFIAMKKLSPNVDLSEQKAAG
jgi:MFS family permease